MCLLLHYICSMKTLDEIKSILVKHSISHAEVAEKMGITPQGVRQALIRSPSDGWMKRLNIGVIDILLERQSLIQDTLL